MIKIKFGYPKYKWTTQGRSVTVVYFSTDGKEMLAKMNENPPGTMNEYGTLISISLEPVSRIWELELNYSSDASGSGVEPPDTSFGKKSARLEGSMLSMPLESSPKYLVNWNYYLAAAPGVTGVPAWWATAKKLEEMPAASADAYMWLKSPAELPVNRNNQRWHILKECTKPGVESRDVATYTMSESASYRSFVAAIQAAGDKLNHIVTPMVSMPYKGNWKCDSASVQWNGKRWIGSYSYSLSGDTAGWDTDLYAKE